MTDLPGDAQPETSTADPAADDGDGGAALERVAESIDDARDAGGSVAANEDITSRDDERAGEHSQDPDGDGGRP